MRIAILALQGAFIEHSKMLAQLGVESFEVRQAADWEQPKDALMAKHVVGDVLQRISTMDTTVCRNAYGRQLGSFYIESNVKGIDHAVPMTFIRAPYITNVGKDVEVLAEVNGHIVAARQGKQLVTAFHPELNDDLSIHRMFVEMITEK